MEILSALIPVSIFPGFTCALQKEILYQGKLFVSENWICFHSKVFGKDTKISIPAFSVTLIKKTKTALLVPNALIIATVTDRYIFVSLLSRDSTYKLLKSVCGHLENTSVGNSPNPSSLENSFRADRPSSLPLVSCLRNYLNPTEGGMCPTMTLLLTPGSGDGRSVDLNI